MVHTEGDSHQVEKYLRRFRHESVNVVLWVILHDRESTRVCQTPAAGKRPRGASVLNFLNPLCGFNSVTQTFPTGLQKTCSTLFWFGQNINFLLGFWWWRLKDRLKKNGFRGVWASGSGYLLPPTINRNLNYSFKATWVVLLQFARSGPRAQPE